MVIWITGLSGAGKTTVCQAVEKVLRPCTPHLVVIDGDVIREMFGASLSYREEDRVIQINRLQKLAKFLSDQGQVVLVAALYAHQDLLQWNRDNMTPYCEVYLDAPLNLVKDRDAKGLYEKASNGEMEHVVGIDVPWNAPMTPDIHVDCTLGETPDEIARQIIEKASLSTATCQDIAS